MSRSILFLLFLLFAPVFVFAGDVSQFVFISEQQNIKPNEISGKITIQAQDASGVSAKISQTACISFNTTSGAGEFSSNDVNWSSVNILTMSKNTANRNFYYKDSGAGDYILTAKIALRPTEETRPCASWPIEEWGVGWEVKQNIVVQQAEQQIEQQAIQQQQQEQRQVVVPVEIVKTPEIVEAPIVSPPVAPVIEEKIVIVENKSTIKDENVSRPETKIQSEIKENKQEANVISLSENNNINNNNWIFIALGFGVVGGISVIFVRRKGL